MSLWIRVNFFFQNIQTNLDGKLNHKESRGAPSDLEIIWCRLMILIIAMMICSAYNAGVDRRIDKFVRLAAAGSFTSGVCVAATQKLTGLGRFACHDTVSNLMNQRGLSPDPSLVVLAGGRWPDIFNDTEFLNRALFDLFNLPKITLPTTSTSPPYNGVRGIGWGMDIGYAEFISFSFNVFGPTVESLYKGYWFIYVTAVIFFILAFRQKLGALTLLAIATGIQCLIFKTDFVWAVGGAIGIETPTEQRFLSTLSIIPALHFLCATFESRSLKSREVILLILQGAILAFTMIVRTTAVWVTLAGIVFGLIYWLFMRLHNSKRANQRRYQILAMLILVAITRMAYVAVSSHPGIAANGDISRHNFWPTMLYSLQLHPQWSERYGMKFEGANGDAIATYAWMHYWAQHPEVTPNVRIVPGGSISKESLEMLSKLAFLEIIQNDTGFVLEQFFINHPFTAWRIIHNVVSSGMSKVSINDWLLLLAMGAISSFIAGPKLVRRLAVTIPFLGVSALVACMPNIATFVGSDTMLDTFMVIGIGTGLIVVTLGATIPRIFVFLHSRVSNIRQ